MRSPDGTGRADGAVRTLGDLLYADRTKAPAPKEEEWLLLVRSIAAGNQRALHALYERTHHLVFTLTIRITNSPEIAEELTVDVFHDVWRRAATYDASNGSVVGWIMNQARSRAIDRVRFDQRQKRMPQASNVQAPPPASDPTTEALDLRERRRLLVNALGTLNPNERQAIESAFFSGLTYAEVANRLNQPVGTVKTRIRSALGKLREALGARRRAS